jgi:ABC-type Fe3+/spermidine/putrescine transport system ATPase subunit
MIGRVVALVMAATAVFPHLAAAQNVAYNKTVWVSSVLGS